MNYRVDVLRGNKKGMLTMPSLTFVRVTELESKISVTKCNKTAMIAREEAEKELEELHNLWKSYS